MRKKCTNQIEIQLFLGNAQPTDIWEYSVVKELKIIMTAAILYVKFQLQQLSVLQVSYHM